MKNMIQGHDLYVTPYSKVKNVKYDFAVLPWGAIEPHNLHLPYLTDSILSYRVSVDAVMQAHQEGGVQGMVLPPISLGSQNPGQRELPFCIHARYETQKAILTDIVHSLNSQDIKILVLINGHGGNYFRNMVRDLAVDYPDFLLVVANWYDIVPTKGFFSPNGEQARQQMGEHAGELETSVMMYYHPELVCLADAGKGDTKDFAIESLNQKIAWIPRDFAKMSKDTGIGNPAESSAEKGEQYTKAVIAKLSKLFIELVEGDLY